MTVTSKSRKNVALSTSQIKKRLKDLGITLDDIGSSLVPPVTQQTVWKNVMKIRGATSARVQEAIASRLGLSREEVFGKTT
jgi:hypothetical protein